MEDFDKQSKMLHLAPRQTHGNMKHSQIIVSESSKDHGLLRANTLDQPEVDEFMYEDGQLNYQAEGFNRRVGAASENAPEEDENRIALDKNSPQGAATATGNPNNV